MMAQDKGLKITKREVDDLGVLSLSGHLDASSAKEALQIFSEDLAADGSLILDLTACDYISSMGLRTLLIIAKEATRCGGTVTMAGLRPEIADIMEMTGFDGIIPIYQTAEEAVVAIKEKS